MAEPTLRYIYKVLASQYDPLGIVVPFTTRAKVLIQDMWKENIGWDEPIQPPTLRNRWLSWEQELPVLSHLEILCTYIPPSADTTVVARELHIFCDASERACGSVAYMCTVDNQGQIYGSFVLSRSRVAPRKQLSVPCLELCAGLTGAQLAHLLQMELTVPIQHLILWSDSTTVQRWLHSELCRYEVFVRTRVAEIQTLTDVHSWRYVESIRNPADEITHGLALEELTRPHRWPRGPDFLYQSTDKWPIMPSRDLEPDKSELKKSAFVAAVSSSPGPPLPIASSRHGRSLSMPQLRSFTGRPILLETQLPMRGIMSLLRT